VDDETCIFDFFREICPGPQCVVTTAAHGVLAEREARAGSFDVAFIDYFLGDMIGTDVAQRLRKIQPDLKVILMSGFLVEERAAAMETAGASAFLLKPFSAENVHTLVARFGGGKGGKPRT
jgi:DNA-binding NtrC family response regulator